MLRGKFNGHIFRAVSLNFLNFIKPYFDLFLWPIHFLTLYDEVVRDWEPAYKDIDVFDLWVVRDKVVRCEIEAEIVDPIE